jgi:hypothetical protein
MSVEGRNMAQANKADSPAPADQMTEAVHMIGSALVTGGIAAILVLAAIPVSIGLGARWGLRAAGKRLGRKAA